MREDDVTADDRPAAYNVIGWCHECSWHQPITLWNPIAEVRSEEFPVPGFPSGQDAVLLNAQFQ